MSVDWRGIQALQFLTEDEMWDVILFLYDFTGQRPRAREAEEHK